MTMLKITFFSLVASTLARLTGDSACHHDDDGCDYYDRDHNDDDDYYDRDHDGGGDNLTEDLDSIFTNLNCGPQMQQPIWPFMYLPQR